jgi:lysophospholipase L1-like esterase
MWRYAAELKQPLPNPRLPFHHRPNAEGTYYGAAIRTNSLGFRDNEYPQLKPTEKKRILFLGDSFTLGWGVSFADTFTKRVESRFLKNGRKVEAINLGVGNYNSAMEVELFKQKGLMLHPDAVVLMYYINDAEPTPIVDANSYRWLKHFYLPAYLSTKFKQIKMMKEQKDWLLAHYQSIYNHGSTGFGVNSRALLELIDICKTHKIMMLMVNIPDLRRLKNYPFTFATDHIRNIASNNQVPFFDLMPIFEKFDEKSIWVSQDDPHMNAYANLLAAEKIYQELLPLLY